MRRSTSATIGYTKANTQAVCWAYNAAKGVGTDDAVYYMARCLLGIIPLSERGTVAPMPINGAHRRHLTKNGTPAA